MKNRTLKQSVRRNENRFPKDFMFQLTAIEWRELITNCDNLPESIKFSPRPPMAFTEQGVSKEEFFQGVSIPRSKEIMRIFRDVDLVEQLGSGIPRILQ